MLETILLSHQAVARTQPAQNAIERLSKESFKAFAQSSVFLVNRCRKVVCNDINDFSPEGTATLFYVSDPCDVTNPPQADKNQNPPECNSDYATAYFVTAAHVTGDAKGRRYADDNRDVEKINKVPLSDEVYLTTRLSEKPWKEFQIKTSEVARMYKEDLSLIHI